MPPNLSPAVLVVYQDDLPLFLERLNGLLRALFPEASLECFDAASGECRLRADSLEASTVVLVGRDRPWLDATQESSSATEPLALLVPRPKTKSDLGARACFRADDPEHLEELVGRVAQRMQLQRALELGAHRSKISELARIAAELGRTGSEAWLRRLVPVAVGLGTLLALTVGWKIWQWTQGAPAAERFGFEDATNPWSCQDSVATRGCVSLRHATQLAKSGASSLELVVDLDPSAPDRRSAEIWAPVASLDLEGRRVVAWVRPTRQVSGSQEHRTGFQIYVKDAKWRSCYGPWIDASADDWQRLQLKVGSASGGQFMEPGFDGRQVAAVGVKFALPSAPAPSGRASGSIYVDAVSW